MQVKTEKESLYQQIYKVAKQVPCGKVATYGQVARIVDRCSARQVGYAMAALSKAESVCFDRQDRIDLVRHGWQGPETAWLIENGFDPMLY